MAEQRRSDRQDTLVSPNEPDIGMSGTLQDEGCEVLGGERNPCRSAKAEVKPETCSKDSLPRAMIPSEIVEVRQ